MSWSIILNLLQHLTYHSFWPILLHFISTPTLYHLCPHHFPYTMAAACSQASISHTPSCNSDTRLFFLMLASECSPSLLFQNFRCISITCWLPNLKFKSPYNLAPTCISKTLTPLSSRAQPDGIPSSGPLPSSPSCISSEESFHFPSYSNLSRPVLLKAHLQ